MTSASSRRGQLSTALLAVVVLASLLATATLLRWDGPAGDAAGPAPAAGSPPAAVAQPGIPRMGAPAQARPAPESDEQRSVAVQALLDERARAVLAHDRPAFLAGIDPAATVFGARQAELFDALADVPLAAWAYTLHPAEAQPGDPALDARYGTWWAPRTVLGVALRGVDADPAESDQGLTFVRRDDRWLLAADDDFAVTGAPTARQVWDGGPVRVVRGVSCLVLGHPDSLPQMRQLADEVDAAVPRVSAVWGTGWAQQVAVVVPADQDELGRIVPARGSLSPIAALAVAGPVRGGTVRGGDRIVVNPVNLAKLGPLGRRIVLTHEVTHVASRAATGPATPTWLSEGLADHVGYEGTGVAVTSAAAELREQVRRGQLPPALPAADAWSGDNPDLSAVYEQAWLAVELIVRDHGREQLLRVYRDLGSRSAADVGALDEVLRADLGTDLADFTAAWQASLRRQLG